jgi:hypothetical protein
MFGDVRRYILPVVDAAPLTVTEGRLGWQHNDMRSLMPISDETDGH